MKQIFFIKTRRESTGTNDFITEISNEFSLDDEDNLQGYAWLIAFLNGTIEVGYQAPEDIMLESVPIKYLDYLSSGLTSSVYKGEFDFKHLDNHRLINKNCFIIKRFKSKEYYNEELRIMNLIAKNKYNNASYC